MFELVTMVVKEEKEHLHHLLSDAIRLLCKSGLPLKSTFRIDALIGITLEDDEVLLISFKEKIENCNGETDDETNQKTIVAEEDRLENNEDRKDVTVENVDQSDLRIKDEVEDVKMDNNARSLMTSEWNFLKQISSASCVIERAASKLKKENESDRQLPVAATESGASHDHQDFDVDEEMPESGCEETVLRKKHRHNVSFTNAPSCEMTAANVNEGQNYDVTSTYTPYGMDLTSTVSVIQICSDDRIKKRRRLLPSHRFSSLVDDLYLCHICNAKLRGHRTLMDHVRAMHYCWKMYNCANCGQSFKWRSGLQRHRSMCNVAPPGD